MSSECLRATFLLPLLVTLMPFLVGAFTLWAYRARPAWAALPDAPERHPLRPRDAALYGAVFALVGAACAWRVAPYWRMQNDEERDAMMAFLCAGGRACPLVGNEMNRLRVQLGPLNRYLMTACQLVTRDPRLVLAMILVFHATAAAWSARVADSLFGAPAGLAAGAVVGTHEVLLGTYVQPSNGAWVPVFLVGTIWGTLRWLRGEGGVPFVAAATSLVCAMQLHGTAMEYGPIVVGLGLAYRPPTPRWALYAAGAVAAVMYLPWLWFQFSSDWSGFRAFSLSWITQGSTATGPDRGLVERLTTPLYSLGPLTLLIAPGFVALVADRDPARRGLLAFAAVPFALSLMGAAVSGGAWASRYCVPFLPGVAIAAFAWVGWVRGRFPRAAPVAGAVALAAAAYVTATGLSVAIPRDVMREFSHIHVFLAEDIEATRALGARGFRTQDLEHRVHGQSWARGTSARAYLGHWLLGVRRAPPPAEHVLVTECEPAPPSFARWQQRLVRGPGHPHCLVGYLPTLGPARMEVEFERGAPWALDDALPFSVNEAHGGDSRTRAMLDPALAYPRALDEFNLRWQSGGAMRVRVRATLSRCAADRTVTLLLPSELRPTLALGGAPRAPDAVLERSGDTRYRVRVPRAACEGAPLEVAAEFRLEPGESLPRRVDLYEEP